LAARVNAAVDQGAEADSGLACHQRVIGDGSGRKDGEKGGAYSGPS
jgi:hypothetical protein